MSCTVIVAKNVLVNQHIGYYDCEVKIGLVIEQIEEYAKEKYGIEYGVEVE